MASLHSFVLTYRVVFIFALPTLEVNSAQGVRGEVAYGDTVE